MKPKEQQANPESVKIISFQPVVIPMVIPTSVGGLTQLIWGLGDDGKMYQWDSKQQEWVI